MVQKDDIPEAAICPKCGNPMQAVDLHLKAAKLGAHLPEGSYAIGCCGFELTIENDDVAQQLINLLLAYHREHPSTACPPESSS